MEIRMKKEGIIWIFLFALLSLPALAANQTSSEKPGGAEERVDVIFYLRDFQTRDTASNKFVLINVRNEKGEIKGYYDYTDSSGMLDFAIEKGKLEMELQIDDIQTPGKDYYVKYSGNFEGDINKTLFIFPVGSVSGLVLDKLDNVVGGAELQFECGANYASDFPPSSDAFGSFKWDFAPVGSCKIYANYGDAMGMEEASVVQGNVTDVEIRLDKTIISFEDEKIPSFYLVFAGFLAVVIAYIIIIFITGRKRNIKKPHEEAPKTDRRMQDIMSTLRKEEKLIVELLLKSSGRSTQAKVYHETGMPKTTLHRQINSLEIKNIIKVEKIGKMKKIELTPWFMGKEPK